MTVFLTQGYILKILSHTIKWNFSWENLTIMFPRKNPGMRFERLPRWEENLRCKLFVICTSQSRLNFNLLNKFILKIQIKRWSILWKILPFVQPGPACLEDKHLLHKILTSSDVGSIQQYTRIFSQGIIGTCHETSTNAQLWVFQNISLNETCLTGSKSCCDSNSRWKGYVAWITWLFCTKGTEYSTTQHYNQHYNLQQYQL